jgi:hypothetical protein
MILLFVIFLAVALFIFMWMPKKKNQPTLFAQPVLQSPRQQAFDEDVLVMREAYRKYKIAQHEAEVLAAMAQVSSVAAPSKK